MTVTIITATVLGFMLGSVPFSAILVKWLKHKNIRDYGDGNPGAINAWKAGGALLGLTAGFLDFLKGAAPAAVAIYVFGVEGWGIVPIAIAPVAGHAFSPFLKFKGGKAIAASFGVWSALTLYEGPVMLGLLLAFFYLIVDEDAWAVVLAMLGLLAFLAVTFPEGYIFTVWAGDFTIVTYKHRLELAGGIHLKPATAKLTRRRT